MRDTADVVDAVAAARGAGTRLAIRGGGTLDAMGAPAPDAIPLDLGGIAGIVDYDPAELVVTLRPGTRLAQVTALLAGEGQRLAFDPLDAAPMFARPAGAATIGGVVAGGIAGPLRLSGGAPRDHLLGFEGVTGRAERFVAGGRVVKNVTGFDLAKLVAGSRGRLVALTQLSLRTVPAPRTRRTLMIPDLAPAAAVATMSRALASPAEVAAAAHLPDADGGARTILLLHGVPASVAARAELLRALLGPMDDAPDTLWTDVALAAPLAGDEPLWRIVVPPSGAAGVVAALGGRTLIDWGGNLVWYAGPADAAVVRAAAAGAGGHATLWRADPAMRAVVSTLHPPAPGVAALEARVAQAFDPDGVFATGCFA